MLHWIHWKGKGWVIGLVAFGCSLASEVITRIITNDETYYQKSPYPLAIALLVAAIFAFYTIYKLEKKYPVERLQWRDTLVFIPIIYWPWILLAASVVVLLVRSR